MIRIKLILKDNLRNELEPKLKKNYSLITYKINAIKTKFKLLTNSRSSSWTSI